MAWDLTRAIKSGATLVIELRDAPSGRTRTLPPILQYANETDQQFLTRARAAMNGYLDNLNGQLTNEQDVTAQLRGSTGGQS